MGFNTAAGRAEITATAAQEDFDFVFKIYTDEDIVAWLTPAGQVPDDVADLLILGTDYTIIINGDNGGVFTLTSAASAGDRLTLVRSLSAKRFIEYPENGDLRPSILNSDQNYQTYLVADSLTAFNKVLRLPENTQGVSAELPSPVSNAYLKWSNDAKNLESSILDGSNFEDLVTIDTVQNLSNVDILTFTTAIVKDELRGGVFIYDATQSAVNNGITIFDGWVRQYSGVFNVKWAGAKGIGLSFDDSDAIEATIEAAPALNPMEPYKPLIPSPDVCEIYLPAGEWNLTRELDTFGKEIVWLTDPAAIFLDNSYINGRIMRDGYKITDKSSGTHDNASLWSVMGNRTNDEIAPVSGFTNPNQLSKGNGRDTVAIYAGNRAPPVVYGNASVTSYNSTGATLSTSFTSDQLKKLKKGMIIHTRHTPEVYAGYLESWTADTITVAQGWYLVDGADTGTEVTPTGTDGIDVNIFRKAWALNTNVWIDSSSYGNAANIYEMGILNTKGAVSQRGGDIEATGIFLTAFNTTDGGGEGYVCASNWHTGYIARNGVSFPFRTEDDATVPIQAVIRATDTDGNHFFDINNHGNIEMGHQGGSTVRESNILFHSSGVDNTYDVKISSISGDGTVGNSTCIIYSKDLAVSSDVRLLGDNSGNCGTATHRWSEVFAVNGTINTSDEREKQQIASLTEQEKAVAVKLKGAIKTFKWNDSVEEKGEDARIHVGVIAQEVKAIFESEDLIAEKYGIFTYDEWEDEYMTVVVKEAVFDDMGKTLEEEVTEEKLITKAGNRYGIRYTELLAFVISAI